MVDKEHLLITKVKEQFADGKMNRREFLRDSTLLGLSLAAAYAFVGKVTGVEYVPQARAASMKKGGTLRIGHLIVGAAQQPHSMTFFTFGNFVHAQAQTLTRTGADNITRPLLAKSWKPSEDLRTWTIKLHEDAVWTDGKPFTVDDVIANFHHLLDPSVGSGTWGLMSSYMLEEIEKDGEKTYELWDANALEKVDDYTINFNIRTPQVAIPEHLYNYTSAMADPEGDFRFGPETRGSGPYQCIELSVEKCVMEAKRPYWGREGYLDRVEFIDLGPDSLAQFAALASKQVHGFYDMGPDQIDPVAGQDHLQIYSTVTGQASTLSLRVDQEPWGDNRIRTAMKLAIEPDKLVKVALGPMGAPGEHHHVSPVHPEYVKLPNYPLNIEKAKKLMAEAGFADGIEADLTTVNEHEWLVKLAQAYKQQLARIGIKIKINAVPMDAFWGLWDKDPVTVTFWSHRPLAIQIMQLVYRSGTAWNTFRWSNAEFDAALEKAEGTVDIGERKKYVKILEEILQSEGPMLQPVFTNTVSAWDKKVKGFAQHPSSAIYIEDLALES